MESLYREMMEMREHLLRRIELLEDDVDRLSEDNYQYAREIYTLEKKINSLSDELRLQFEGQKSSKENYQEGEETPRMVY